MDGMVIDEADRSPDWHEIAPDEVSFLFVMEYMVIITLLFIHTVSCLS